MGGYKMKGIILAGGKGTRLKPLTDVTNKHLVSVGKVPMIEYPLYTLKRMGASSSICVVTGGENFEDIAKYLGNSHPNINFSFHYQREAGGIAQALSLVEPFVGSEKLAVILGDNIFEDNFFKQATDFYKPELFVKNGAMVFLKEVLDPERFGVAEIKGGKIISIEEKPKNPKSNLAVTGIYLYDNSIFDKIRKLKPSNRGEYEISDVNNMYLEEGRLNYHIVKGFWSDAGTHESREIAEGFVKSKGIDDLIMKKISR
jgi:glucose-1-phosphate thymidylyltransferase